MVLKHMPPTSSIIDESQIATYLKTTHHTGIVLVGGCFDVLHFGHISFLNAARLAGKHLYVLLESDEFMIKKKKKKPVHTQEERAVRGEEGNRPVDKGYWGRVYA